MVSWKFFGKLWCPENSVLGKTLGHHKKAMQERESSLFIRAYLCCACVSRRFATWVPWTFYHFGKLWCPGNSLWCPRNSLKKFSILWCLGVSCGSGISRQNCGVPVVRCPVARDLSCFTAWEFWIRGVLNKSLNRSAEWI